MRNAIEMALICNKKCGFKIGYQMVADDYQPQNQWGTGQFPIDEQDEKILAAWPGQISFINGDNPFPVGFAPKSWDDPMIEKLYVAGFSATVSMWVKFRPLLSSPPPHLAPFSTQIGLTMENSLLCYKRDFITRFARYDGREKIWAQQGFQITDFFDGRPPVIREHA